MKHRLLVLALLSALAISGAAQAACNRNQLAEIPVTMKGGRGLIPVVAVKINGSDAQMVFDTGAAGSLLGPDANGKFGLSQKPGEAYSRSMGRIFKVSTAVASEFTFAGTAHQNVEFQIPPDNLGPGVDGALGQDYMRDFDLEIDLAHGVVRLFSPRGCESVDLAYWRGQQPVSVIDLEAESAGWPRIFATAKLNGVPLRVMFDTGTSDTHMTYEAGLRAGVDTANARSGATSAPGGTGVGGGAPMASWMAHFARFQIGDERVSDPWLKVVEKPNATADMLIGADFFVAHRVFVSRSQHKLYFTANPGAAFPRLEPQASR